VRWAQSVDVQILRKVTEFLLPGLACPCCGAVTFAGPPPGLHAGSVSYGPILNATAVLLSTYGNVHAERSAQLIGMLLGAEVSAGRVDKAVARMDSRLRGVGFDEAMAVALAADETPVNVLDKTPVRGRRERPGGQGREGRSGRVAARADRPAPRRPPHAAAGHRLPPQGQRRGRDPGRLRREPHHRRVHRLPAPSLPDLRHPAVLPARHPQMQGRHETRPRRRPELGALACWLRDYKEQVFLFTRDFSTDWTDNISERGAKAAKRHQAVSGYWHTRPPSPTGAACAATSSPPPPTPSPHSMPSETHSPENPGYRHCPPSADTNSRHPVNGHIDTGRALSSIVG
jgi:hypothetical protein